MAYKVKILSLTVANSWSLVQSISYRATILSNYIEQLLLWIQISLNISQDIFMLHASLLDNSIAPRQLKVLFFCILRCLIKYLELHILFSADSFFTNVKSNVWVAEVFRNQHLFHAAAEKC